MKTDTRDESSPFQKSVLSWIGLAIYLCFEQCETFSFVSLNALSLKDSTTGFHILNIKVNTVWQLVCSKLITFTHL